MDRIGQRASRRGLLRPQVHDLRRRGPLASRGAVHVEPALSVGGASEKGVRSGRGESAEGMSEIRRVDSFVVIAHAYSLRGEVWIGGMWLAGRREARFLPVPEQS